MISLTSPIQNWITQFSNFSNDEKLKYLAEIERKKKEKLFAIARIYLQRKKSKFYQLFPDEGDLRRELYTKHVAFFDAGSEYRARLFMAGNRVGKTVAGSYEATLHATGLYPHWWTGKRFDHLTEGWVAGKTNETTRDIIQKELFGNVVYENGKKTVDGSGTIPKHLIDRFNIRWKSGVADFIDTVRIKHASGEWSIMGLKSYQQGRGSFEGTAKHYIWLDEEPPQEVYTECVTRTATTKGLVFITFTPLEGTTEMVDGFIKKSAEGVNFMVQAGWNHAPHLSEEDKADLLAIFPKHEHEARSQGIPYAGSGLIFPIDEKDIICEPFDIPSHWVVITGIDFGWDHPTAATALAWDRDKDTIYVFDEYKGSEKTPAQHAPHIKAMCHWSPVAWPHDGLQHDKGSGVKLKDLYAEAGLNMLDKNATFDDGSNGVEAGLMMMLTMMEEGRWKVFNTCEHWLEERRGYHREKGKIVKLKDDVISSSRYALMMIATYGITKPREKSKPRSRSKL
ncbi:terminase large subunit domain-containing protein [Acinetobacter modestus]|uniref:phage terminase large subunit family protein n=1 Tax=Acinetobacter modestus TaxID=1776740 RepID=UPI00301AA63D